MFGITYFCFFTAKTEGRKGFFNRKGLYCFLLCYQKNYHLGFLAPMGGKILCGASPDSYREAPQRLEGQREQSWRINHYLLLPIIPKFLALQRNKIALPLARDKAIYIMRWDKVFKIFRIFSKKTIYIKNQTILNS